MWSKTTHSSCIFDPPSYVSCICTFHRQCITVHYYTTVYRRGVVAAGMSCTDHVIWGIVTFNVWMGITLLTVPQSTVHILVEMKQWKCFHICSLSWSVNTATLINLVKGGGRALPILTSLGYFFHHDGIYARKRPLPLCVYSELLIPSKYTLVNLHAPEWYAPFRQVLRIRIRIRIRIHRIHVFLGLQDPDLLVRGMDPDPDLALDPDPDPSIIMLK